MSTRTYQRFKRDHGVSYLLGIEADAKTVKGEKSGILTGIVYLAPSKASGYQTCPFASPGCIAACLFTAGRASFDQKINAARITRTKLFFENRTVFMRQLILEIGNLVNDAHKRGMKPAVRLNGTSDLKWERIACCEDHNRIMDHFPNVQFYDYTKIPIRYRRNLPDNYALTFSLAESNDRDAVEALKSGTNVAAVFHNLPDAYHWTSPEYGIGGFVADVIPGDITDARFTDAAGVIVGLTAKGKAKQDRSGFVR